MGLTNEIAKANLRITQEKFAIVVLLTDRILGLPENPKISRVSKNAFTMSVSSLTKTSQLSPGVYDFKYQHKKIHEYLLIDPTTALIKLKEIIAEKRFRLKGEEIKVHDEVIEQLKGLL